jgi:diaminopimelate decarboxylase
LVGVLKKACQLNLGAECASIVEVKHAIQCGFAKEKIVFDSPAKTNQEIKFCIENGVYMNCDNLNEVDRVANVFANLEIDSDPRVGLRINPGLGAGKIATSSTATKTSKFGVYVGDYKSDIIEACRKYKWLNGFHVHVGSQGCGLEMLVDGAKCIALLAVEINALGRQEGQRQQISILDFGGGLGINYDSDDDAKIHYKEYAKRLKASIREFNDDGNALDHFEIFTEFGRSMIQKCGWVATYVNNVKNNGGRNIATCHVGSDMFLRTAYLPRQWSHRITVFAVGTDGRPRERTVEHDDELETYDIAGPLCFSGDMMATKRSMPRILQGDWLVVHDAGGYTYSMHSRYNSIPAPAVYSYTYGGKESVKIQEFKTLKKRETWEEVCQFWC